MNGLILCWPDALSSLCMKCALLMLSLAIQHALAAAVTSSNSSCRYIPSDPQWPSLQAWDSLNTTVSGRLIRTLPVGHVCHDPTYNEEQCRSVRDQWNDMRWRTSLAGEILSTSFANDSCDPFAARDTPCTVGGHVQYSINVTSPEDAAHGLAFAREHNVRVVVKNTGHESVGLGGLALWMHNNKRIETIQDYESKTYCGPAIKIQSGVQADEAYEYADKNGYMIAGGECGTVGLAGGFTSGGGHGPASSYIGLAADQTLEFEVVLANGTLVRATPENEHADLYWALSGGGPGFGVVWSVTYKLLKDMPVVGGTLSFESANNTDGYATAIETWHSLVTKIADIDGFAYTNIDASNFSIEPLFFPKAIRTEVLDILAPLFAQLDESGVKYELQLAEYETFFSAWKEFFDESGSGGGGDQGPSPHTTTRLIPRRIFDSKLDDFSNLTRTILKEGGSLLEMVVSPKNKTGGSRNAVNDVWQQADMLLFAMSGNPNSTEAGIDEQVTNDWGGALRTLAPESGTYVNEADPCEPDFQQAFYGEKYPRLLEIKKKYDPEGLLYANTAVGSEEWARQSDGRLCRIG